ncbi:hypothetical protein [Actinacidiphila alni]|uniref:hypothetical protein n=1 Tax=Actinacidiphila alni TaxID=380248 RepID=UPI003455A939
MNSSEQPEAIEPEASPPEGAEPPVRRRRTLAARFRGLYGESPWHLLTLLGCLAVCAYAAQRLLEYDWFEVAKWIVLGALVHDLVLVPLYAGADWLLGRALRRGRPVPQPVAGPGQDGAAGAERDTAVRVLNHLRVPAYLSLLLLLVYWPLVFQDAEPYAGATGLDPTVFLGRWLLITAVLFGLSALLFTLRSVVRPRRGRGAAPPPEGVSPDRPEAL